MDVEQEMIEIFYDRTLEAVLKTIIGTEAFLAIMHGLAPTNDGRYDILLIMVDDMMESDAKKKVGCKRVKAVLKQKNVVACCLVSEIWMSVHTLPVGKSADDAYKEAGPPRLDPQRKDMLLFHFETKKGQSQKMYELIRDKNDKVIEAKEFKDFPEGEAILKGRMTGWLEKDKSSVN